MISDFKGKSEIWRYVDINDASVPADFINSLLDEMKRHVRVNPKNCAMPNPRSNRCRYCWERLGRDSPSWGALGIGGRAESFPKFYRNAIAIGLL
jgi:hypothetical protein